MGFRILFFYLWERAGGGPKKRGKKTPRGGAFGGGGGIIQVATDVQGKTTTKDVSLMKYDEIDRNYRI